MALAGPGLVAVTVLAAWVDGALVAGLPLVAQLTHAVTRRSAVAVVTGLVAFWLVAENAGPAIKTMAGVRLRTVTVYTTFHCDALGTVLSKPSGLTNTLPGVLTRAMLFITALLTDGLRTAWSRPAFFAVAFKGPVTSAVFTAWQLDAVVTVCSIIANIAAAVMGRHTCAVFTVRTLGCIAIRSGPAIYTDNLPVAVAIVAILAHQHVRQASGPFEQQPSCI